MSIRATSFVDGEFYHIYNRGNSKQFIFNDSQDYYYFMNLLSVMNIEARVKVVRVKEKEEKKDNIISIGSYCLMANHFHILIKQEKQNGISKFMQKISTAYVMYYNKKYKRTGGLFEGKFKSKYAGEDSYLKYLFAYIHLNPLKILDKNWKSKSQNLSKETMSFLERYKYSSFDEYFTDTFNIVNKSAFPDYFPSKKEFIKDITLWFSKEH